MVTQRKSINIIKVFYAVETAKSNYERLLNKVKKKKKILSSNSNYQISNRLLIQLNPVKVEGISFKTKN